MVSGLLPLSDAAIWGAVLVFVRCAAALALLPGFGERAIPARVKLVLAAALALAVAPLFMAEADPPGSVSAMGLAILAETVSGLLIGLVLRLFIFVLQVAGAIAAQSTSLSQIFPTGGADQVTAISNVLIVGGLALLMLTGFHVKLIVFLAGSYTLFPLARFPSGAVAGLWTVDNVARMFALGFQLAAPFVLLSVLYNIMLGIVNRAMPQLMVAFVGAPLITLGSLVLLFLTAPVLLPVWLSALDTFLANPASGF